jgi:hypothetical protein
MAITPEEARLQFVLRFVQLDLATFDDDAWYALQDELVAFLLHGTAQRLADPESEAGVALPLHRNVRQGFGLELASWVRADLRHATCAILRDEDFPVPDAEVRVIQAASKQMLEDARTPRVFPGGAWEPGPMRISHRQAPGAGGTIRYIEASPRDAFLFVLSEILTHEAIDRIARCPDCRTLFYRLGKQKYCSTACTNRVGVRQWRQRQEGKHTPAARAPIREADTGKPAVGAEVKRRRRPRTARV